MKASELVAAIQRVIEAHGDVECLSDSGVGITDVSTRVALSMSGPLGNTKVESKRIVLLLKQERPDITIGPDNFTRAKLGSIGSNWGPPLTITDR